MREIGFGETIINKNMKFLVKKGSLVSHYANLEERYNSPNHSPEGLK